MENGRFKDLVRRIRDGEKSLSLAGLPGSSKYFLVQALARALERPVLYISPDRKKAEASSSDLSFFLGKKPTVLQAKEIKGGNPLFPSPEIYSLERIGWLDSAAGGAFALAEASALFEKTIPVKTFRDSIIVINKGQLADRDELAASLVRSGYVMTDFVQKEGEASVRGAIVDI